MQPQLCEQTDSPLASEQRLQFHNVKPELVDQRREILQGLTADCKYVSPKYFYDEAGCRLFDRITELEEYYVTRAERSILQGAGQDICGYLSDKTMLIEPGSGSCEKIRMLLAHYLPASYAPIEISEYYLERAARQLRSEFPDLTVHAVCADFTSLDRMPDSVPPAPKAAFFPGSTIGNFEPKDAIGLLANLRRMLGVGGKLLIGVDLLKDPDQLHAAYNDQLGVTAQFNLNLLTHIGRILKRPFNTGYFRHKAFFNRALSRIEMHLECQQAHSLEVDGHTLRFAKGETIHTENSYKYSVASFEALASKAGFRRQQTWTDEGRNFSFHCLVAS
ncbi:L-histidine N(alpha)-methyltransferase [Marinobacter zhejiangensis]|uniref:Dimethylhistidine N-methyltransferase n=1 Tax=Marinobacter zhejiangensis TaxID=488535 RepID=A0A1I4Q414_9GAMM|nr:L-histidine N(alpha)-methyltransferase [Marinobacter zhejiangensis]SFM34821.1 dimethylhistidine N-methyltransferase [Marinobacter zhejiangensis]